MTASDYIQLTKPRLSMLVWMTTLAGYFMAPGEFAALPLAATLLGTIFVVGGANALNQVYERDIDALMRRTRGRPLPSGRLTAAPAAIFAVTLAGLGVLVLGLGVNWLSAALGAAGFGLYVFAYTPLKQRSTLCTLVGAVPGAIPPLIGWAAATGTLEYTAWLLFGILFLWQMPHFLAIARLYREDYRRGGMVMLGIEDADGPRTYRQMIVYSAALVPVSMALTQTGVVGGVYFAGAALLSLGFVVVSALALRHDERASDRTAFLYSLGYLPALLALMLFDKTLLQ
ncbi:MAG: protoheme IX farnesyltransferase [Acidobacteria bacterium]|nr:protoheme IX farnesyltransferase [Acidobacteriota bacterium]